MAEPLRVHIPISEELLHDMPSLHGAIVGMLDGTWTPPPPKPPPPTPAGHQRLLDATDGALCAVVELHAPRWSTWWVCDGCDLGTHAEDCPDWPCSTIELIAERLGIEVSADG